MRVFGMETYHLRFTLRDSYRFVWAFISGDITGLPHTAAEGNDDRSKRPQTDERDSWDQAEVVLCMKWTLLQT